MAVKEAIRNARSKAMQEMDGLGSGSIYPNVTDKDDVEEPYVVT